MTGDRDFEALRAVTAQSASATLLRSIAATGQRAAHHSVTAAAGRRAASRWLALPLATRLHAIGVALLTFAAAYAALSWIVPITSRPVMPSVVWLPVALVGLLCVVCQESMARAWERRTVD